LSAWLLILAAEAEIVSITQQTLIPDCQLTIDYILENQLILAALDKAEPLSIEDVSEVFHY